MLPLTIIDEENEWWKLNSILMKILNATWIEFKHIEFN
jgi:hypothetical protein